MDQETWNDVLDEMNDYSSQMIAALANMPDRPDLSAFEDGEALFNWMYENATDYGTVIINQMLEYADEGNWLSRLKEAAL